MKELLDILATARELREKGASFAVGTVAKIGGSTYRRPGARMLIAGDGRRWGAISGGCLEGEVAQQALEALRERRPRFLPFELGDDDIVLGFGTGCDGIVHVLIEPVGPEQEDSVLDLFDRCFQMRRRGVLATVIDATGSLEATVGRHLLLDERGEVAGHLHEPALRHHVLVAAKRMLEVEKSDSHPYLWHNELFEADDSTADLLFEVVRPPVRLIVFGEGHDVRAIINVAKQMAWRVEIVGRKPEEFLAERFPEADGHQFLMHPEDLGGHVDPDPFTAALVMNHTYIRDRDLMAELLKTTLPYIGMLGPKERTARMVDEVRKLGRTLDDADLARLFGPVGLDVGTETPEEIALAAVAEIQAVLHGRVGGHLRSRRAPIHDERASMAESSMSRETGR